MKTLDLAHRVLAEGRVVVDSLPLARAVYRILRDDGHTIWLGRCKAFAPDGSRGWFVERDGQGRIAQFRGKDAVVP